MASRINRFSAYDYRQMKLPVFISSFILVPRSSFFKVGTYGVELPENESHSTFILVSNLRINEI
jgi:hypothetical protein